MKITLTFQGRLPAKQRGVSPAKASLRAAFHPQIAAQVKPILSERNWTAVSTVIDGCHFVSPAHHAYGTAVELDVLLLVPPSQARVGDVDNRLKTLIDGLTCPANSEQMQGFHEPPDGGPTYCLMSDDNLVQQITVDSRRWHADGATKDEALVVVTATIVRRFGAGLESPVNSILLLL